MGEGRVRFLRLRDDPYQMSMHLLGKLLTPLSPSKHPFLPNPFRSHPVSFHPLLRFLFVPELIIKFVQIMYHKLHYFTDYIFICKLI
jgi:hypothetical protein